MRENAIDVGFYLDEAEEPDFVTEYRLEEPMRLLAAPDHPLASGAPVYPRDLNGEALILTEKGCAYRKLLEQVLVGSGVTPRSILGSASNQSIKQLTISGMGITFLPEMAAEEELRSNKLVALNWAGPAFHIMTCLSYHKDKWISPAARAFLDIAKEELRQLRKPERSNIS